LDVTLFCFRGARWELGGFPCLKGRVCCVKSMGDGKNVGKLLSLYEARLSFTSGSTHHLTVVDVPVFVPLQSDPLRLSRQMLLRKLLTTDPLCAEILADYAWLLRSVQPGAPGNLCLSTQADALPPAGLWSWHLQRLSAREGARSFHPVVFEAVCTYRFGKIADSEAKHKWCIAPSRADRAG
jgi:hypothetical protein